MKIITKRNEIIISRCNRCQTKDWKRCTYNGNRRYIGLWFWYIIIKPITSSINFTNNSQSLRTSRNSLTSGGTPPHHNSSAVQIAKEEEHEQ